MARSNTVPGQSSRNQELTEAKLVELINKEDGSVRNAARSAMCRLLDRMAKGWNVPYEYDEEHGKSSDHYISTMERKRWGRSRVVLVDRCMVSGDGSGRSMFEADRWMHVHRVPPPFRRVADPIFSPPTKRDCPHRNEMLLDCFRMIGCNVVLGESGCFTDNSVWALIVRALTSPCDFCLCSRF